MNNEIRSDVLYNKASMRTTTFLRDLKMNPRFYKGLLFTASL